MITGSAIPMMNTELAVAGKASGCIHMGLCHGYQHSWIWALLSQHNGFALNSNRLGLNSRVKQLNLLSHWSDMSNRLSLQYPWCEWATVEEFNTSVGNNWQSWANIQYTMNEMNRFHSWLNDALTHPQSIFILIHFEAWSESLSLVIREQNSKAQCIYKQYRYRNKNTKQQFKETENF